MSIKFHVLGRGGVFGFGAGGSADFIFMGARQRKLAIRIAAKTSRVILC